MGQGGSRLVRQCARGVAARGAQEGGTPRVPYRSRMARLSRLYKSLFHWPDGQIGWVRPAFRAGRRLLEEAHYDVIYASAPPFSGLRVAAALSSLSGVPWVAELRDLWTDNHAGASPGWRLGLERRWEASLLGSASALVTVSAPLAAKLQRFGKPTWEVRNGFDPEDFAQLERPAALDAAQNVLQLVFTGNVYDGHYDVDVFCAGLAAYVAQGGQVRVHVVGRNTQALRKAADSHGVEALFRFDGVIPRPDALSLQRHADVLLFFLWPGEQGEGVYSAKLFEYAGAARPVLAVGPPSDVGRLIENAGLGVVCSDAEAVAAQLRRWQRRKLGGERLATDAQPGHDLTRTSQFRLLENHLLRLAGLERA
jgi:glycosyltransferase involved in cell wall biosynthesis